MAGNFVQEGDVLDLVAPYDVVSGAGMIVNSNIFAVALGSASSGAAVRGAMEGVWDLACSPEDTFSVGAAVYWDDTTKECGSSSSSNYLIGVATEAKIATTTTVRVRLNGVSV